MANKSVHNFQTFFNKWIFILIFEIFLRCQAASLNKFCTNPPTIANTLQPKKIQVRLGDSVNYTCKPNYHAFGITTAICGGAEGKKPKWIGPDMTCEKMCGKLPVTKKAYPTVATKASYPPFTEVSYVCKYGRKTLGSATAICRNGKWKPPSFLCIKQCGVPPVVSHALFYPSSNKKQFPEMTKVQYKCSKGYQQGGLSEAWCYQGKWRGPTMECKVNRETLNEMCGEPGHIANGHARVENSPVRHIIYSCANGMQLLGSEVQTCKPDGTWDHKTPTCILKPNYCGLPPTIQDAKHNASLKRPAYADGDVVAFTCIPGFFHMGHHLARCNGKNASWTGLDMTCQPMRCNPPGEIRGGRVEGSEFTYRSRIHFRCNIGHKLIGYEYLMCQENGEWNGAISSCEPITCPPLSKPENGARFGKNLFGSSIKYYCYDGYKLVGSEERMCSENQTWTGTEPRCEPFTCPPLSDPLNGRVNAGVSVNSVATYVCNNGYELQGPQRRICRVKENWTGSEPKCIEKGCLKPAPLYNGYITGSAFTTGSIIFFQCKPGYKFVGRSKSAICLENKKWSIEEPKCYASCMVPDTPELHAYKQDFFEKILFSARDKLEHDSSLEYYCGSGYKPSIPKIVWCNNGTWSLPGVKCVKDNSKLCEIPRDPVNGKVSFEKETSSEMIEPGNVAIFVCEPKFQLMGVSKVVCGPNGRWMDKFPRCVFFKPEILGSCHDPGYPENGYKKSWQESMTVGSSIIFSCRQGYFMSGSSETTCLSTLEWSNPKPKCLRF